MLCFSRFFVGVMFRLFFSRCCTAATLFFFSATPLLAQGGEGGDEAQAWVLSFAFMIAFLALTLLILLRPTKRSDSAFTYDEVQAQKEEEMKKIKSSH